MIITPCIVYYTASNPLSGPGRWGPPVPCTGTHGPFDVDTVPVVWPSVRHHGTRIDRPCGPMIARPVPRGLYQRVPVGRMNSISISNNSSSSDTTKGLVAPTVAPTLASTVAQQRMPIRAASVQGVPSGRSMRRGVRGHRRAGVGQRGGPFRRGGHAQKHGVCTSNLFGCVMAVSGPSGRAVGARLYSSPRPQICRRHVLGRPHTSGVRGRPSGSPTRRQRRRQRQR